MNVRDFVSLSREDIDELIAKKDVVELEEQEELVRYEILSTPEELAAFLHATMMHESALIEKGKRIGGVVMVPFDRKAIVTFDISPKVEWDSHFHHAQNLIFLGNVFLCRRKNYIGFKDCYFKKILVLGENGGTSDLRIHLEKSKFYDRVVCNVKIGFLDIRGCETLSVGRLDLQNVDCDLLQVSASTLAIGARNGRYGAVKITSSELKRCGFSELDVSGSMTISQTSIQEEGILEFNDISVDKFLRIQFKEIEGKIKFSNCLCNGVNIDFKPFLMDKFSCLLPLTYQKKKDYRAGVDSLKNLHSFAKKMEDAQLALDVEFYEKKFHRDLLKEKFHESKKAGSLIAWIGMSFFEYYLAYFCKWKHLAFRTIPFTIVFFAMCYAFAFDQIKNLSVTAEMQILSVASYPLVFIEHYVELLLQALYFSLVTFVTIGYGDCHPTADGWVRFVAGFEGLLGVILISFLTVVITRRYVK